MKTLAVIGADGRGDRLGVLSDIRAKPAVPFGGKYRIIDFVLSNCANSGIRDIGIFTQYRPYSLNEHVRTGRPWDLDCALSGGVRLLPAYQTGGGSLDWYRGTADAVYQNLDFILMHQVETVLVLPGDHVYKMDYGPLIEYHKWRRADVTICGVEGPLDENSRFRGLRTDSDGRIVGFQKQPSQLPNTLVSTGIYLFRADVLVQRLQEGTAQSGSSRDFEKDLLPRMLALGDRVYAHAFRDYWVDLSTVEAYWQANMDLLLPDPPLDLGDADWRVCTRDDERPPARICPAATVSNSLVSDGCVIEGRVEHSVLSPGVHVSVGAVVQDSILFSDCEIGPGAVVERAIVDKNVHIGWGAHVGADQNYSFDLWGQSEIGNGLTLIGRDTHVPPGLSVARGSAIDGDLSEEDFAPDLTVSDQRVSPPVALPRTTMPPTRPLQPARRASIRH
jgi:glucose-1-phosphate adenylyltransferase